MNAGRAPEEYWDTSITQTTPEAIRVRGYDLGELISGRSFADTVHLLLLGELPSPARRRLVEAIMVASVDHGLRAPSVGAVRIAASCGLPVNHAMASAVNILGDVHGGAGQQLLEDLDALLARIDAGEFDQEDAARSYVADNKRRRRRIPGFGHPYHRRRDPRRDPVMDLAADAVRSGDVAGRHVGLVEAIERELGTVPMNVDGAAAAVCGELGMTPAMARGMFVVARSAGLLAHAIEESGQPTVLKSVLPPWIDPPYSGSGPRTLPADAAP